MRESFRSLPRCYSLYSLCEDAAKQCFNTALERIRLLQEKQLKIWETSVQLLASIIEHNVLASVVQVGGACKTKVFQEPLDIHDYLELCGGRSAVASRLRSIGDNRSTIMGEPSPELPSWLHRAGSGGFRDISNI